MAELSPLRRRMVGVSRPDMTNLRPTIWHSSNSHQSEFGYVLMSPRPSLRCEACYVSDVRHDFNKHASDVKHTVSILFYVSLVILNIYTWNSHGK